MGSFYLDKIIAEYDAKLAMQANGCRIYLRILLDFGLSQEELARLSTEISKLAETMKTVLYLAEEKKWQERKGGGMKKISTGESSTLKTYRNIAAILKGSTSAAVRFIDKKIADSPNGENEEVLSDEGQMLYLLMNVRDEQEGKHD